MCSLLWEETYKFVGFNFFVFNTQPFEWSNVISSLTGVSPNEKSCASPLDDASL
jgi:hypothetical protein